MHVVGAGLGRTGTYSLKLALNRLGVGPCHHMEAVILNMPVQVPLWAGALDGRADWPSIYQGFPDEPFPRNDRTEFWGLGSRWAPEAAVISARR